MIKNRINLLLIEYAIGSMLRQKSKNIFIMVVFVLLVFLLSSVLLISSSIKTELQSSVDLLPEILVQNIKAGRVADIDTKIADDILQIAGVDDVVARVWGYYRFKNTNFTIMGIDGFEKQYKSSFVKIANSLIETDKPTMIIGSGVKKILSSSHYDSYFNFIKPNGEYKKVFIGGIFDRATNLESNDIILMPKRFAQEIFDMQQDRATDIVVKVLNKLEISTIVNKIKMLYPNTNIITKDEIRRNYEMVFNYKSGIFLTIFIIYLSTFFMIIYDKLSGLDANQREEIGVLKAIGWSVDNVLVAKFYEGLSISLFSYLVGMILANIFVYIFQAPLLRDIFQGFSTLKTDFILPFTFDWQVLLLVFFLSVPIYLASIIIPSWRVATMPVDEVIR